MQINLFRQMVYSSAVISPSLSWKKNKLNINYYDIICISIRSNTVKVITCKSTFYQHSAPLPTTPSTTINTTKVKVRYRKLKWTRMKHRKDKRLECHKNLILDHVLRIVSISCSLFERILYVTLDNVLYFIIVYTSTK